MIGPMERQNGLNLSDKIIFIFKNDFKHHKCKAMNYWSENYNKVDVIAFDDGSYKIRYLCYKKSQPCQNI